MRPEQARMRHQPPVLGGRCAAAGLALEFGLAFCRHCVHEIGVHETASSGLWARMIAADACSWTWWVGRISTLSNPARGQGRAELGFGEGAGDASGPGSHVCPGRFVHAGVGDHV